MSYFWWILHIKIHSKPYSCRKFRKNFDDYRKSTILLKFQCTFSFALFLSSPSIHFLRWRMNMLREGMTNIFVCFFIIIIIVLCFLFFWCSVADVDVFLLYKKNKIVLGDIATMLPQYWRKWYQSFTPASTLLVISNETAIIVKKNKWSLQYEKV